PLYGQNTADTALGIAPGLETEDLRVFTAPGRTELGGNHTDHNRGKVLAASVQLDSVAIAAPRKDGRVIFRSTAYPDVVVDLADPSGAADLAPKAAERGTTEALVRGIAAEFAARGVAVGGFVANADSTVLSGSGLSSSAAVEVLLGRIFDSLYGGGTRSALEIAQIGQRAENNYFGKPCGLMDQIACASGGAVAIDFADPLNPALTQLRFDPAALGYALCVVDTRGSHADLTPDYAAIPTEMKGIAGFFGKSVLRELDAATILDRTAELRAALGDRGILRALHFFNENKRVEAMAEALQHMETAGAPEQKQAALSRYLDLVNASGASSWELLQNVYSPPHFREQGVSLALALTREFLSAQGEDARRGACRVHGGGFAGTIQACIALPALDRYQAAMEAVFGEGSLTVLRIRPVGAVELLPLYEGFSGLLH
ncbi:MAG: galactokinase, partial [Treponema sp.]|nr:galactokinase [Treponema sp.]